MLPVPETMLVAATADEKCQTRSLVNIFVSGDV